MDDAEHFSAIEDGPVEAALADYFDRVDRGENVELTQIIAAYPGCEDGLRRFLDEEHKLHGAVSAVSPAAPQESLAGDTLGDYRILRELGRGGMGVVYEAEQLSLGRRVALKVLPFAAMLDKQQLARFKNEARAAATLDHPNIVAIHSVGSERGVHYYAMQLIAGQSLAQMIATMREKSVVSGPLSVVKAPEFPATDHGQLTTDTQPIAALSTLHAPCSQLPALISREYYRTVARLGIQAAEALDHAHQNGILHRDIKPGNLMLDAEGKLYVTDFGLARIEADAGLTMTGDVLGTLRYMSPEQALAKRVVVDHRSDIYSLGVTLYELIALQPAFGETDRSELLKQIAFDEPRLPRQFDRRIPVELETIVLKAMRKSPEQRYATAQDLADDLQSFLENKPIKAKPPTRREQAVKWSQRHPAAIWATVLFLLATTIVSTTSAVLVTRTYKREAAQRELAERERKRAEETLMIAQEAFRKTSNDLRASLLGHEWVQPFLDSFLDDGQKFYDSLLEIAGDNPEVVDNRAQYLVHLSKSRAQDYKFDEAHKFYDEAVAALVNLVERFPENQSYSNSLIYARISRAEWLNDLGQDEEALRLAREAVAFRRRKLDAAPDNIEKKELLVHALEQMMSCQITSGDPQGALESINSAFSLITELVSATDGKPGRYWYRHMRAICLFYRGSVLSELGRLFEANEATQSGVEMERSLVDAKPNVAAYRVWLAIGLQELAKVTIKQQQPDAALEAIEEAEQAIRRLSGPSSTLWSTLFMKAEILAQLERREDAAIAIEEATKYARKSNEIHRLNDAAWQLSTSPWTVCRDGQCAIELALKACEPVQYKNPKFVDTLACAYAEKGDFASAIKWSEKAHELATNDSHRREIAERLEAYRSGNPWRENP